MQVDFPYAVDRRGRTASTGEDEHVRDLVEQVLFTAPGERVNRPSFGSGLLQLVFAPMSDELAGATQFLVQGALQQWLGDVIEVESVEVEGEDSTLAVQVVYTVRRTRERRTLDLSRGV
jgi:phage baseplate assembly protein W